MYAEQELQKLMHTGRWNNESDLIHHELELVKKEIQHDWDYLNPPPLSAGTLERIYLTESAEDRDLEQQGGAASLQASRLEVDRG